MKRGAHVCTASIGPGREGCWRPPWCSAPASLPAPLLLPPPPLLLSSISTLHLVTSISNLVRSMHACPVRPCAVRAAAGSRESGQPTRPTTLRYVVCPSRPAQHCRPCGPRPPPSCAVIFCAAATSATAKSARGHKRPRSERRGHQGVETRRFCTRGAGSWQLLSGSPRISAWLAGLARACSAGKRRRDDSASAVAKAEARPRDEAQVRAGVSSESVR